jgi:indole-3-glycerol phosphate synthase
MDTILQRIMQAKQIELKTQKLALPLATMEDQIRDMEVPLNFSGALLGDRIRLIAEVKKASPSKGILMSDFDPVHLSKIFVDNGAAAISVLTDSRFLGHPSHLKSVKTTTIPKRTPVLRKDFIFDPYQVYETRALGADAMLLIVSLLSQKQLTGLMELAGGMWLQVLVEVHNEEELELALDSGAEIIGINNRNLHTFATDLLITERIAPKIPSGKIVVSESGITTLADVHRLKQSRVDAILVGEAIITADDIGCKVRELALGRLN